MPVLKSQPGIDYDWTLVGLSAGYRGTGLRLQP